MVTRQTPELVPATERQRNYIAGMCLNLIDNPVQHLVPLLDAAGIEITDAEREGFICKGRASTIITQLKREDEKRVANL